MRFLRQPRSAIWWIITLAVILFSFTPKPVVVQAGQPFRPLVSPAIAAAPRTVSASLGEAIPGANDASEVMDGETSSAELTTASNLPAVEEIMLTPPANQGQQTTLSLRFADRAAERLSLLLPVMLGDKQVTLRRSVDDPAVYWAPVNFNWKAFAEEQARRQIMASEGEQVPVFEGHRLQRTETIQFVDPAEIHRALQNHQPIRFTPLVLQAGTQGILASRELLVNDISVVEDATRTWDPCSRSGRQMGSWTFGALMTAIANDDPATHLVADQMVQQWLDTWSIQQNVNHFPVSSRLGMLSVIRSWRLFAQDRNGNVDVSQAPFQLNAIVNRIDLATPANPAGETRFVFGYAPCSGGEGQSALFNVIVEYRVPVAECSWAAQWHALDTQIGPRFNAALQTITDQVAKTNASQNLDQLRTNETFASPFGIWEQRQFALSSGALKEVPPSQTPNGDTASGRTDFNQSTCNGNNNCQAATLTSYINAFQQDILNNDYTVPAGYPSQSTPFLGGSALNGPFNTHYHQLVYWQGNPAPNSNAARSIFSENTCNGCHGRETQVEFQQVVNRQPGPPSTAVASALSAFLVGCSTSSQSHPLNDTTGPCPAPPVNTCNLQNALSQNPPCISWVQDPGDPSGQTINQYAELSRRAQNMSTILQGCRSDGMLFTLAHQQLSSGH